MAVRLSAGETLHLNLVPDREVLLKVPPQEVVVKIDLSAVADRQKHRRTPLNLAVVLDKSGSMTGAKLEKTKQAARQLVDRLTPDDVFRWSFSAMKRGCWCRRRRLRTRRR